MSSFLVVLCEFLYFLANHLHVGGGYARRSRCGPPVTFGLRSGWGLEGPTWHLDVAGCHPSPPWAARRGPRRPAPWVGGIINLDVRQLDSGPSHWAGQAGRDPGLAPRATSRRLAPSRRSARAPTRGREGWPFRRTLRSPTTLHPPAPFPSRAYFSCRVSLVWLRFGGKFSLSHSKKNLVLLAPAPRPAPEREGVRVAPRRQPRCQRSGSVPASTLPDSWGPPRPA